MVCGYKQTIFCHDLFSIGHSCNNLVNFSIQLFALQPAVNSNGILWQISLFSSVCDSFNVQVSSGATTYYFNLWLACKSSVESQPSAWWMPVMFNQQLRLQPKGQRSRSLGCKCTHEIIHNWRMHVLSSDLDRALTTAGHVHFGVHLITVSRSTVRLDKSQDNIFTCQLYVCKQNYILGLLDTTSQIVARKGCPKNVECNQTT